MNFINRLSDKSFISFTFDGKGIEEFGMAVVSNGDRYSTNLHPNFSNTISTVPGRIGSIYWGTEITNNTIEVNLATDCMTSRQFLNFKNHFRPGKIGQLSFAETEFCYCYAIISENSIFDFIPFDGVTTINGKDYKDTIYKGTTKLIFSIPDIYSYSDKKHVIGEQYVNEPWFLMSGLPLTKNIIEKNCFLSGGTVINQIGKIQINYNAGNSSNLDYDALINSGFSNTENNLIINCLYSTLENNNDQQQTIYAYNAGNAPARTNICFLKTINFESEDKVPWNNIIIGDTIIEKPRMFKDIDYTIAILNTYKDNWVTKKTEALIKLRESLDSQLRSELIGIVNATGDGLNWSTINEAISEIRKIVNGKQFTFSINGIYNQNIMMSELTVHTFGQQIGTITQQFVENIGDSTNGKYIIIKESNGLNKDGSVDIQAISISEIFDGIKIFFLNTYLV